MAVLRLIMPSETQQRDSCGTTGERVFPAVSVTFSREELLDLLVHRHGIEFALPSSALNTNILTIHKHFRRGKDEGIENEVGEHFKSL